MGMMSVTGKARQLDQILIMRSSSMRDSLRKRLKLKSEPRSKKSMHVKFPMESPRVRKMRLIY
jgi:hypothetical protein